MPRYARRRTDYKVTDFVRCKRCGKLTLKKTATEAYDGVWYGSDCVKLAMNDIEQAHRDEQNTK